MAAGGNRSRLCVVVAVCAFLSGCAQYDVSRLAGDDTAGRDNGTPGSTLAREFLIDQLRPISQGLNGSATGDAAYTQSLPGGTNVVSVIQGTDLADQYVVVGAHYDHLGSSCEYKTTGDEICNGATDNAAGVAAVLAIARSIADQPVKPRRSVVLALWDREEDGLVGSRYYADNPLVPLAQTVGYVNFDIQGANLLPRLRNTSFAVAAESGGPGFQEIVRSAINAQTLDTELLSSIFGQNRSDYVSFLAKGIPSVFFTDATGPCYHTNEDEIGVVDFGKLDQQIAIALRVTRDLANTATPPPFVPDAPLATYADAVVAERVINLVWRNRGRFSAADQDTLRQIRADLRRIVLEGRAAFDGDDAGTLLGHAATLVISLLPKGECTGFLRPSEQQEAEALQQFARSGG
jgi:acetylornithine deacetylase/succinyl-diaminopimelate desuccinylase-like protein